MRSVDFELDMGGLRELMNSSEMQSKLRAAGDAVASVAGPGYEASVFTPGVVPIASVHPESDEAKQDNYENNTLLKALGASGLSTKKG